MSFDVPRVQRAIQEVRRRRAEVLRIPDTLPGYERLRTLFAASGVATFEALKALNEDTPQYVRDNVVGFSQAIRDGIATWRSIDDAWVRGGELGDSMEGRRNLAVRMLDLQLLLLDLSLRIGARPTDAEFDAMVRAQVLGSFEPLWEDVTGAVTAAAGGAGVVALVVLAALLFGGRR